MNLNKLRDEVHTNAVAKGFWDEQLSDEHYLMLVITELSEAVEADRKGKRADRVLFLDNINTPQPNPSAHWMYCFDLFIKDTVEDELADAFIRLLDLFGARGVSLDDDALDKCTIEDYADNYRDRSFTESIFHIISFISDNIISICFSAFAPEMLMLDILGFAKHLNIDLMWHVEQKMKYNQSRERLHGKKY